MEDIFIAHHTSQTFGVDFRVKIKYQINKTRTVRSNLKLPPAYSTQ